MNSKGRRFFLYLLLAVMVVTQVAFTKTGKDNTSEESAVNSTKQTDETENETQTEDTVLEVKNENVAAPSTNQEAAQVIIINEQIDEETEEILLGANAQAEESEYQNMIVSYADPYLSVRAEASKDSAVVGKMFPGSCADIVERGDEWTKIQSGNVEGYIQNIYVCFDDEAEDLADQLGGKLEEAITLDEEKKLREAEAKKAAEEAAKKNAATTTTTPSVSASSYDVCLLAAIIDWEANAEPYEGKLAVAYVVLNRVNAGYGSDIQAVLSARGQFGGVTDGYGNWSSRFQDRINKYTSGTNNDCLRAAQDALAGANNPLNATYLNFNTVVHSYSQCQQIGNHIFYNN